MGNFPALLFTVFAEQKAKYSARFRKNCVMRREDPPGFPQLTPVSFQTRAHCRPLEPYCLIWHGQRQASPLFPWEFLFSVTKHIYYHIRLPQRIFRHQQHGFVQILHINFIVAETKLLWQANSLASAVFKNLCSFHVPPLSAKSASRHKPCR